MSFAKLLVVSVALAVPGCAYFSAHKDDSCEHASLAMVQDATTISMTRAIEIAMKRIPNLQPVEAEVEMDKSGPVFEVEFASDSKMIEVKINGVTGEIIEVEKEDDPEEAGEFQKALAAAKIDLAKAIAIAEKEVGGFVFEAEIEMEDDEGCVIEVGTVADGVVKEVEIDAATGKVIEIEVEDDDDDDHDHDDDDDN